MEAHREIIHIDNTSTLANSDQAGENAITLLPIELTNITGTNLENLNDDCLLEIFSCNSLNSMDLCSLAETCTRFNRIVQRAFPKNFGISYGNIEPDEYIKSTWVKKKFTGTERAERIVKNFGPLVVGFSISGQFDGSVDFVDSIAKYCDSITVLLLNGMKSIDHLRVKLKSIFERLQRLTIYNCHLEAPFLTSENNFHSLTELIISKSSGCVTFLQHTYPNLKRFSFLNSAICATYDDNNYDILLEFIGRHKQLQNLGSLSVDPVFGSKFISLISESCKELQVLTFYNKVSSEAPFDVTNLHRLTKLSSLDIALDDSDSTNDTQFVSLLQAVKGTIKWLTVDSRSTISPQVLDAMSQLPNLRCLGFRCPFVNQVPWKKFPQINELYLYEGVFSGLVLFNAIKHLKHLKELILLSYNGNQYGSFELREIEFIKIVDIVKRREHVLTLKCRFNFNYKKNCETKVRLIKKF